MKYKNLTPELRAQWDEARVKIPVNRQYLHYKGGVYTVTDLAFDCETMEPVVHYRNMDHGSSWVRTARSWLEPVPMSSVPVTERYKAPPVRFRLLGVQ